VGRQTAPRAPLESENATEDSTTAVTEEGTATTDELDVDDLAAAPAPSADPPAAAASGDGDGDGGATAPTLLAGGLLVTGVASMLVGLALRRRRDDGSAWMP
jgi:hypothetical protein